MASPTSPPFLTNALDGTGGVIKQADADFRVDEIPAYEPTGEGDHVIARIRKCGIPTFEAVKRIAIATGVSERDIGTAGLKDARAITTQQISLPPPLSPEHLESLEVEGIEIISAARHPHKLRTGHLRGNNFVITVRDCDKNEDEAAELANSVLTALAEAPGMPNWFGEQRFGRDGNNASAGRDLLLGQFRGRKPKPRMLRLFLSSIQSLLFNEVLIRRVANDDYRNVIGGDLLKKTDSGGIFASEGTDDEKVRFRTGAVVATGPMFGPKMMRPAVGTALAELENAVLEASGLTLGDFARYKKLAPGTRRPLSVALGEFAVKPIGQRAIEVSFSLPSGSYATSVLREITKPT